MSQISHNFGMEPPCYQENNSFLCLKKDDCALLSKSSSHTDIVSAIVQASGDIGLVLKLDMILSGRSCVMICLLQDR